MVDGLHALGCTVSEEVYRVLVKILLVGISIHNIRLDRTNHLQGAVEHFGINLHAAGIEHWYDEGVFLLWMFAKQYWHRHQFEGRNGDEFHASSITDALRHTHSDTQSGIGTRTTTYSHSLQWKTMGIEEIKSLIYIHTQLNSMVRT